MAFDTEADDGVRGMTLANSMGDLEMTWEPKNDEKVRALIEKKMREGVTFFVMKPVIGDVLHMRRKLKKVGDLKGLNVTVKDPDIEALLSSGDASLFRNGADAMENKPEVIRKRDASGKLDHAAASRVAVKQRTVGVAALQGG